MGLFNKLMEKVRKLYGKTDFQKIQMATCITDDMAAAIDRWVDLYSNHAPWLTINNHLTLGLPSAISREIATLVTLESRIEVAGENGNRIELNPRAQFISDTLRPLVKRLPIQTEYACAFGGMAFRPYIDGKKIAIDCVNADNFYPTKFNARGEITGAVFVEKKKDGRKRYVRIEEQEMLDGGMYRITNRAFESYNGSDVGTPIPLDSVDEWKDIAPEVELQGIDSMLFSYFKIPNGNVVDSDSMLGVSVFARAESSGLLEEADKQFQRLAWEYEGGEMAIDATIDAFKRDKDGNPVLPTGKERLFRVNELSIADTGDGGKFTTFAPALRDASFSEGLNRLLMRIEDACGIARGTYSDANDTVRTATELRISKQRTYATVTSIQFALQDAIDDLAHAVDTLTTLYGLAPLGEFSMAYTWDDSILGDTDAEREKDRQDVLDNLMQPWEYRVKWYGETIEQAKAALPERKTTEDVIRDIDKMMEE